MGKKFQDQKEAMIQDNEAKYGQEIRQKYGDDTVGASNAKLRGMSQEKLALAEQLCREIEEGLAAAFAQGDPAGALAQQVCGKHRQWLCLYWPEGMYSKAAHLGLAQMYVEDDRFRANYDKIAPGCTEFLRDAIAIYCKE